MSARLVHVRCGYGGTGVSPPGYCAVMPYFDVVAPNALGELRVTDLDILDASTRTVLARANVPIELRIWLPGRDEDHNEITAPFDGSVVIGRTLRLRALTRFDALETYASAPRLYRLRVVARAGDSELALELEGPLDSAWATG